MSTVRAAAKPRIASSPDTSPQAIPGAIEMQSVLWKGKCKTKKIKKGKTQG
jgi:hypothetical protein